MTYAQAAVDGFIQTTTPPSGAPPAVARACARLCAGIYWPALRTMRPPLSGPAGWRRATAPAARPGPLPGFNIAALRQTWLTPLVGPRLDGVITPTALTTSIPWTNTPRRSPPCVCGGGMILRHGPGTAFPCHPEPTPGQFCIPYQFLRVEGGRSELHPRRKVSTDDPHCLACRMARERTQGVSSVAKGALLSQRGVDHQAARQSAGGTHGSQNACAPRQAHVH